MSSVKELLKKNGEQIVKWYQDGVSTCEIGRKIKCSNASVYLFLRDNMKIPIRKVKSLDDYKENILLLHKKGFSGYNIAKQLKLTSSTFGRYAKQLGLDLSSRSSQREDLLKNHTEEIILAYKNGESSYSLAKKFNCSNPSVLAMLHKNNIEVRPLRQLAMNERYFENIDSWEKAYLLGLIMADGHVAKEGRYVRMELTDRELVEYLKIQVNTEAEIYTLEKNKDGKNFKTQYGLNLGSKLMCMDLNKYCSHRKTYDMRIPTIAKEWMPAWLLGYSDGDGSLGIYNKHPCWQCSGIMCAMDDIYNYALSTLDIIGYKKVIYTNKDNYVFVKLRFQNLKGVKFLDHIYTDHKFCLQRKYQKYLEIKEWEKTHSII